MKKPFFAGKARHLSAAVMTLLLNGVLFAMPTFAVAASWAWSTQGDRERLEIQFDTPQQAASAARSDSTRIDIAVGSNAEAFRAQNTPSGNLIDGVTPQGNTLQVQVKNPTFGYVVSRPTPRSLRIDVFTDPLGARWRPAAQAAIPPRAELPVNTAQPPALPPSEAARQTPARTTAPSVEPVQLGSTQPGTSQQTPPTNAARQPDTALPRIKGDTDPRTTGRAPITDGRTVMSNPRAQNNTTNSTQPAANSAAADVPTVEELERAVARMTTTPEPRAPFPEQDTPNAQPGTLRQRMEPSVASVPPQAASASAQAASASAQAASGSGNERTQPQKRPAVAVRQTEVRGGLLRLDDSVASGTSMAEGVSTTPAATNKTQDSLTQTPLAEGGSYGEALSPSLTAASGIVSPRTSAPVNSAPSTANNTVPPTPLNTTPLRPGEQIATQVTPQLPVVQKLDEQAEQPASEQRARLHGERPVTEEPQNVIYVDEKGNIIDKPPDSQAMFNEAKSKLEGLQFAEAYDLLQQIKTHNIPRAMREELLYLISEALINIYQDDKLKGFEAITLATNEAMNFNLESSSVPNALFRLGILNLDVGNQQDAIGYIGALHRRYPYAQNVPLALYLLGQDQLKRQQYAEAARSFQTVIDEYPESRLVQQVSRSLAEALYRQGHYERAQIMVDFIDRRWPRLYIDDPSYLMMVGEILTRTHRYSEALQAYWTYYNLLPDADDSHKVLLQIGVIYHQANLPKGMRQVYDELLRKFPQSSSAPTSIMALGEQSFTPPNPTLDELLALYAQSSETSPEAAYVRVLKEYPNSPEALYAKFRTAAALYANGETAKAMAHALSFINAHPGDPQTNTAREIILRGFNKELALALEEENNDRILTLWEAYPDVREAHAVIDDDLRVALARAHLNRGNKETGMDMLSAFLEKPQGTYSDYVYNLFLSDFLANGKWQNILVLGDKVSNWTLPTDTRNQLDYARAISAENLGMIDAATDIWKKLYALENGALPLYQKAYATYFMARNAERQRDLKQTYDLNLETLNLFRKLAEEQPDKADQERVRESLAGLMDVTEVAGRFAEALDWTEQYRGFVPESSPDYAGLLFRQARLYRKMGDMVRWRNQLESIIRAEPDSVFGRMAASELRTQQVARDLSRFTETPTPATPTAPTTPATPPAQ